MRVAGWHVDGFGHLADLEVHDLPDGLVVLHGPNEAGKSTLVDYLVGMLFGFPSGSTRLVKRPPLRGGSHGGKLWLADGDDSLLITRTPRQLTVRRHHDDATLSAAELRMTLGGANRALFEAVFAVDLDALSSLAALDDRELNDLVFSAGVVGAGRSARAVLAAVDARRTALYKPRGRAESYRITALRADLREAEAALGDARRAAQNVPQLRRSLVAAQSEAAALRDELSRSQAERHRMERLIDIWPQYVAAIEANALLAEADEVPTVDPDAMNRVEVAESALASASLAVAEHHHEVIAAERRVATVVTDAPALAAACEVERLRHGRAIHERDCRDALGLASERARLRHEVDGLLAQLGDGVTARQLTGIAVDLEESDRVRACGIELARAIEAEEAAGREVAARQDQQAEAIARLLARRAAIASEGPADPATIDRQLAQLEGLLRLVERSSVTQGQPQMAGAIVPAWLVAGLLVAAVLFGVAAAFAAMSAAPGATAVLLVGGVAAGVVAWLVARTPATEQPGLSAAPAGVASAEAARAARSAGLSSEPSIAEVVAAIASARSERDQVTARAAALSAVNRELVETRAATLGACEAAGARRVEAQLSHAAARHAWSAALEHAGLPSVLGPAAAAQFCEVAGVARARMADLATLERANAQLQAAISTYADEVVVVAVALGLVESDAGRHDSAQLVDQLTLRVGAALEGEAERADAERELGHRRREADKAQTRLDRCRSALSELLLSCGVATSAEARRAAAVTVERCRLQGVVADRDRAVALAFGNTAAAQVNAALSNGDPARWAADLRLVVGRQAAVEEQRDVLVAAAADLQRRLASAEVSADVATAALQLNGIRSELHSAVREWTVLGLVAGLVSETLARYQRERQPRVLVRAQALFSIVTDGRYPHLRADEGCVVAVDKSGNDVPASGLSRGTREQLYLCLRFALAESLGERTCLPIILDDVLVNFDDARAPRVAAMVAEVARHRQVLAFTCTASARNMLLAASPDATVVPLDRTTGTLVPLRAGAPTARADSA